MLTHKLKYVSHLYDPVLRWPSPLSLEHRVDVGRHCHRDRLRALLRHVPLLGVLVDLVVVQPAEGDICGEDDLGTILLHGSATVSGPIRGKHCAEWPISEVAR